MSVWAVLAVLLGIAGFYVFLAVYLVFHLLSRLLFGERSGFKSAPRKPWLSRLKARLSREAITDESKEEIFPEAA